MLVLLHKHEVMLEKRDALGIWGGLWSLPEVSVEEDSYNDYARKYGIQMESIRSLPQYDHGFTHFRLRIQPKLIYARSRNPSVELPGNIWLPIEDALGAAIPVPVRNILSKLVFD